MEALIMGGQLLLSLSILVTIHEFGHFIAARMFGIKVEKFYLFFDLKGFKLFSFKKGDTEYGIGWMPLGGYVKIAGMIDESMDSEQMQEEPQPWEFRSKKPWQKLIVMLGGIIMNVILGIIIFMFYLWFAKEQYLPVTEVNTTGIYASDYAQEAGIRSGDKLISIRGEKLGRWDDYTSPLMFFGAPLVVERDGKEVEIILPDSLHRVINKGPFKHPFIEHKNYPFVVDSVATGSAAQKAGILSGDRIVGIDGNPIHVRGEFDNYMYNRYFTDTIANKKLDSIQLSLDVIRNGKSVALTTGMSAFGQLGVYSRSPYQQKKYSFGEGVRFGAFDAFNTVRINAIGLKRIFTGQEKASESISGPFRIATLFSSRWDWSRFWFLTGLLSMVLALMNALPIPALDGGHCVIVLLEWVRGKPLSDKVMMRIQTVGLILVIGIMVFACGNDLISIFGGK